MNRQTKPITFKKLFLNDWIVFMTDKQKGRKKDRQKNRKKDKQIDKETKNTKLPS